MGNSVEHASKELRYGAQLELMYYFDKTEASCKICGDQLNSEKLTLSHLQQKHKVEYNNLNCAESPRQQRAHVVLAEGSQVRIHLCQRTDLPSSRQLLKENFEVEASDKSFSFSKEIMPELSTW